MLSNHLFNCMHNLLSVFHMHNNVKSRMKFVERDNARIL